MNLTRADSPPREAREFFYQELMPLAKKLQDKDKVFFPIKADPKADTYYVKREKTMMSPEDFEAAGRVSMDSFKEALIDMWVSQGNPELAILAPTLSTLAKSLYFVEEQNEEISPFMYVMF